MNFEYEYMIGCISMLSSFVYFVQHRYPDVFQDFFREYSDFDYLQEKLLLILHNR